MSQGGIYDHLGGGYSRYSTDAFWLVPHFEKMLYDNAQLLELLALVHAHRPDPLYAERAAETVGWMMRDMTAEPRERPRRVRRVRGCRQRGRGRPLLRLDRGRGGRAARRCIGGIQARLRRDAGRQLGGPHDPAPRHAARIGGGRDRAGPVAAGPVRGARAARAAGTRRQGAGGLERPGDRGPGACRGACSRGPTGSRGPRRRRTSCWRRCRRRMAACSTPGGWAA